jgi:hypothetical protein
MGYRNAAAEPTYAARGHGMLAAPWPEVVDAQVDGADIRKVARARLFGFLPAYHHAELISKPTLISMTITLLGLLQCHANFTTIWRIAENKIGRITIVHFQRSKSKLKIGQRIGNSLDSEAAIAPAGSRQRSA